MKTKEDSLDGEKNSSGTKCYLSKVKKLAVSAKGSPLESTHIWIGISEASIHCMNDRCGGSIIHIGSEMGTHGMAMTASTIMDFANLVQ